MLLSEKEVFARVSVPTKAQVLLVSGLLSCAADTINSWHCMEHPANVVSLLSLARVQVDSQWAAIAEQPGTLVGERAKPHNMCYIIFTSGSTGRPKGAVLQHAGVINYLYCLTTCAVLVCRGRTKGLAGGATCVEVHQSIWKHRWLLLLQEIGAGAKRRFPAEGARQLRRVGSGAVQLICLRRHAAAGSPGR